MPVGSARGVSGRGAGGLAFVCCTSRGFGCAGLMWGCSGLVFGWTGLAFGKGGLSWGGGGFGVDGAVAGKAAGVVGLTFGLGGKAVVPGQAACCLGCATASFQESRFFLHGGVSSMATSCTVPSSYIGYSYMN